MNNQLDAQFFSHICLFQFSTCFEQPCAHHQESQFYQYDLWYMSLYVGDRVVPHLYLFIPVLYMFRATKCSSSGESVVSIRHLVYVTVCTTFVFVYSRSVHISSNHVLIIRRVNCVNTTSGICHSMYVTVWYAGLDRVT